MAKNNGDKSVWLVFFEGLKIYTLNLHKFLLYMAFPVLGQLLGLFLIFGLTFWYSGNLPQLIQKYQVLDNFSTIALSIIVVTLPGLILFTKAFWDYLVAYGALNSMTEGAISTGRVYDFSAHKAVVKQNLVTFLGVWLLFSLYFLIAAIPFFCLLWIFFVYFALIFQVFTFEKNQNAIGCFKRSFSLIKGKFARTLVLLALLAVVTYWLISAGLTVIFDLLRLSELFDYIYTSWCSNLPIEYLNGFYQAITGQVLTPTVLAKSFTAQTIMFVAVGFTLPLRSICFTLWYKNNNKIVASDDKKPRKTVKKTAKEPKKVKKSSIVIEKRGIDPEIIRRARLEDDEY